MKNLPLAIKDFKELIDSNTYYVDKTQFIVDCMDENVTFYTRPRRFGKTLNISMLYYFFSNQEKENAYLFDGLKVTEYPEVMKHQNQYPTIFITLKDMEGETVDLSKNKFASLIASVVENHTYLFESHVLSDLQKRTLKKYQDKEASENDLRDVLLNLSTYLQKHFNQKVIILIDEYDVPLRAAYQNGYYNEMDNFLSDVFSCGLKTNIALERGILTGCLLVSKGSVFSGFNNYNVYSILDNGNRENFGFTESEVKQMLEDYRLENCFDEVKEWYDGYLFGDKEIYNPWSTIKYVNDKVTKPNSSAQSYWANTSGNDIVYNYIKNATPKLKEEFEMLLQGGTVIKEIKPELTYREMDNINNIYSFLLLTGYLKIKSKIEETDQYNENKTVTKYELIIPSEEVYQVYRNQFVDYFDNYVGERMGSLYQGLVEGNEKQVMTLLNEILSKSISYYDNKESFYHGFLTGLFSGYTVESNRESGDGRFDLCIYPEKIGENVAIIIECKHSSEARNLVSDASKATEQTIKKNYRQDLEGQGYEVKEYGISFYKKRCYVTKADHVE